MIGRLITIILLKNRNSHNWKCLLVILLFFINPFLFALVIIFLVLPYWNLLIFLNLLNHYRFIFIYLFILLIIVGKIFSILIFCICILVDSIIKQKFQVFLTTACWEYLVIFNKFLLFSNHVLKINNSSSLQLQIQKDLEILTFKKIVLNNLL